MGFGFGRAPAGSSLFGFGTATTQAAQGGAPMTDANGDPQGSRYLDTKLRRWTFDANGRPVGMSNVRHLVMIRMLTVKDSSAWSGGINAAGGVITANIKTRLETDVREALNDLVQATLIAVVSVAVTVSGSLVKVNVQWRDLGTDESNSTELALT